MFCTQGIKNPEHLVFSIKLIKKKQQIFTTVDRLKDLSSISLYFHENMQQQYENLCSDLCISAHGHILCHYIAVNMARQNFFP